MNENSRLFDYLLCRQPPFFAWGQVLLSGQPMHLFPFFFSLMIYQAAKATAAIIITEIMIFSILSPVDFNSYLFFLFGGINAEYSDNYRECDNRGKTGNKSFAD